MMYTYYNEYPELSDNRLYESQDQLKRVIKQFDDAMITAGVVRAPDIGQLDTNNIPDLDILNGLNVRNTSFFPAVGSFIEYLPLIYCFTDTLQTTSPIYIKIVFIVARMRPKVAADATGPAKYPLQIFKRLEVSNGSDGKSTLSNPMSFVTGALSFSSDTNVNNKITSLTNHGYRNSIINYQKEKGILHLNICPIYRVVNSAAPAELNWTTNSPHLIQLLVWRVNDTTIGAFANLSEHTPNPTSSNVIPVFNYRSGGSNYRDSAHTSVIGYYNAESSYVNGKIVTAPLNSFDPIERMTIRNPSILTGAIADTGSLSGANFNVIINEEPKETYNYYTLCARDSGFDYGGTTRVNLLIYSGNEKYAN